MLTGGVLVDARQTKTRQTIILNEQEVNYLFHTAVDQSEPFFALYRAVFPDWDDIKSIDNWPKVNDATNKRLFDLFIKLDRRLHPDVLSGGLWMNRGFSSLDAPADLTDWEVDYTDCKITY